DRGKDEFWTAYPQKRWHEVTNGYVYSHAVCCRRCRGAERRGPDDHLPEAFELRTNRDVDDTRGHRRAIVLGPTSPSRTIAPRHPHAALARRVHRERPRAPRRRILVRAELGHDDPIAAPAMRGDYPPSTARASRTSDSSRPS